MSEVLRVEKVSMAFGNFYALRKVDLVVNAGERRAIIGPN